MTVSAPHSLSSLPPSPHLLLLTYLSTTAAATTAARHQVPVDMYEQFMSSSPSSPPTTQVSQQLTPPSLSMHIPRHAIHMMQVTWRHDAFVVLFPRAGKNTRLERCPEAAVEILPLCDTCQQERPFLGLVDFPCWTWMEQIGCNDGFMC